MEPPKTKYHYTSSRDFVEQLVFDHIETWSFQRGTDFDKKLGLQRAEFKKLSSLEIKEKQLTAIDAERFEDLKAESFKNRHLIDESEHFHPTSVRINKFTNGAPEICVLLDILKLEAIDVPNWMCTPIYKDAIVFYDQFNNIVSVLNICFDCQYMETKMFHHVNADVKTYNKLKQFFIEIGHKIESDKI